MGIGIAGALMGVSNAMQQEHKEQFETDQLNRKSAMNMWQSIINDPNATPEHKRYATAAYMGIATTPQGKNWGKYTKPYDPQTQQPQQAQQQTPSITLAPQPPANPGPQAPIAAGGGASPGVLQGGANQLPPLAPTPSAVPPPPSPIGMAGAPPSAPVTIPGSATTITGPPPPPDAYAAAGYFRPGQIEGERELALAQAQQTAQFNALTQMLVNSGMDPQIAKQQAANTIMLRMGGTALRPEFNIRMQMDNGTVMGVDKRIDPVTGLPHYYRTGTSEDVTDHVLAKVGSNQAASSMQIVKGGVRMANGQVVPFNSPDLTPEAKQLVQSHIAELTKKSSGSTVTDAEGNTFNSRTNAPAIPVGGSTPPPNPVPKGGTGTSSNTAASGAGGGKLDYQASLQGIKDATKTSQDMFKQVNLLDTAQSYVDAVNAGKQKPDSAKDLALIVQAVRAMNPGTVRLPVQEIELELKRGTYGMQFQRWYQTKIESGTLPKQYRDELLSVIRDETETSAKSAAALWQQNMRGKPLPPHLKRFGSTPPPSSSTGGPPPPPPLHNGQVGVTATLNGKTATHYFPTNEQAEQYRQAVKASGGTVQ